MVLKAQMAQSPPAPVASRALPPWLAQAAVVEVAAELLSRAVVVAEAALAAPRVALRYRKYSDWFQLDQ
jgi:hypothetical protein